MLSVPGAVRLRRSRTAGWRMPAGAVVVSRPTALGNPFGVEEHGQTGAVERHARWLDGEGPNVQVDAAGRSYDRRQVLARLPELAGRSLVCWCREDEPCHADTLLQRAQDAAARQRGRA